jgi:hypothetical protein
LGVDGILCHYDLEHKINPIIYEAHEGFDGGHNVDNNITCKVICTWLWGVMHCTGVRYIINATRYITRWDEATPFKDYIRETRESFMFYNIITIFKCQRVLMSEQGSHFLNNAIQKLTQEFMIHHKKFNLYHPEANGTVESFNKILEHA